MLTVAVINFDFPRTSKAYTHRIGRTGRGGRHGAALTFVSENDSASFDRVLARQEGMFNYLS